VNRSPLTDWCQAGAVSDCNPTRNASERCAGIPRFAASRLAVKAGRGSRPRCPCTHAHHGYRWTVPVAAQTKYTVRHPLARQEARKEGGERRDLDSPRTKVGSSVTSRADLPQLGRPRRGSSRMHTKTAIAAKAAQRPSARGPRTGRVLNRRPPGPRAAPPASGTRRNGCSQGVSRAFRLQRTRTLMEGDGPRPPPASHPRAKTRPRRWSRSFCDCTLTTAAHPQGLIVTPSHR